MNLRDICCDDFNFLTNSNQHNSYHVLHSILGYSLTEFRIEQEIQPFREFVFDDINGNLCCAIRLSHANLTSQNMRIQILALSQSENTISDIAIGLSQMIEHIKKFENINRLYSFIFEHEVKEQRIFEEANFQQEAKLTKHTFFSGKYNDVLVFGTERI